MAPPNTGGTTGSTTGGTKPTGTTRGRTIGRRQNRSAARGGQAYGDSRGLIGNGGVDVHITNTKVDRIVDLILMPDKNWTRDEARNLACGMLGVGD